MTEKFFLGIDLGSVSVKLAIWSDEEGLIYSSYDRVAGDAQLRLQESLDRAIQQFPTLEFNSVVATGSGRGFVGEALGVGTVNEITAQAMAVRKLYPAIRSVIEIGGQDSKLIILSDSTEKGVLDFQMNELCAAGTGAFLDRQAARLGLNISEFSHLSLQSEHPVTIAGRCAVFAKSDMTHHQQEGRALSDIIAGLNDALARSYLSNVVRGRTLMKPVSFQGGVAANLGLIKSFKRILNLNDDEIVVPKEYRVMGATGCAIYSIENSDSKKVTLKELIDRLKNYRSQLLNKKSQIESKQLAEVSGSALEPDFNRMKVRGRSLGIDIGSVSVKIILIDENGVVFDDYRYSNGKPLEVLSEMLSQADLNDVQTVGVTGSGRNLVGKLVGADVIKNEITAQSHAVITLFPGIDSIIEIGGQDAKFIRIENAAVSDFVMNRICAAGTGAFLQEQASRLHIDLNEEFSTRAFNSRSQSDLGSRCTVFMESDLVSHQQQGDSIDDLCAGLAFSIVDNYLEKVVARSRFGSKIIFIGGVARNLSVVSAFESELNLKIRTSRIGHLTAAIGVAILAADSADIVSIKVDRYLDLKHRFRNLEYFFCEDCDNRCRIIRVNDEGGATFGGRCGRWDESRIKISKPESEKDSLIRRRSALLESFANNVDSVSRKRVGIPNALLYFDNFPAWATFFNEIGLNVVVSPPTSEDILAAGQEHLVVEPCLPMKAYVAHLVWLDKNEKLDYLFVPSIVVLGRDKKGRETHHCPYIQSAYQFVRPVVKTPILNPKINWRWHPEDEKREMIKLGMSLGASKSQSESAWERASQALQKFKDELRNVGATTLKQMGSNERVFLLLGKDYNLNDAKLNSNVVDILERCGERVITQDMLVDDEANYDNAYRTMNWTHGKEMLNAATIASKDDRIMPVLISNFGCGPDSFTLRYLQEILSGRPFLYLEVDEHASSVGMETRIEAFLDSLKSNVPSAQIGPTTFIPPMGIKRVIMTNFSLHGYAFAASLSMMGFESILAPLPDEESYNLASNYLTGGECHPFALMLGDFLKIVRSGKIDMTDTCYLVPEPNSCRMGQFGTYMRMIAREAGIKVPIFTRIEDLAESGGLNSKTAHMQSIMLFWEMMRSCDFLSQKYYETRAYERNGGDTDKALKDVHDILEESIKSGKPKAGITRALKRFESVESDRSRQLISIGITGDYYTRVCDFANSNIFKDLERMGGKVMLPSTMTDFVKYDISCRVRQAFYLKKARALLQNLAIKGVVRYKEIMAFRAFEGHLDYDVPMSPDKYSKRSEEFISSKMHCDLVGATAAILEQIDNGAKGILNLITFQCTYGTIIEAILKNMDKAYPDIPKLTLIFEGLKPTHNQTRLEAFMEQVKSK
ncbi:MAG: acyl-CoA dehydratase activase [Pseudomonadota bacterium]